MKSFTFMNILSIMIEETVWRRGWVFGRVVLRKIVGKIDFLKNGGIDYV